MAYDTQNPLGSKDPRDLYDNATNFDLYANGPQPMYPNRFGVQKLSIEGMNQQFNSAQEGREEQFQAALIATGFEDIGNYAAGLTITARNQVFARNGVYYSAAAALPLPYTLTGNWAAEGSNFILRADAPLRSDLAAPTGASLVGRPGGQTVGSELDGLATAIAATNSAVSNLAVRFKVAAADTSTLRTLGLADASNILQLTNPATKVVAIPAQATVAWVADTAIGLYNDSLTTMQITGASGVTLKVVSGGSVTIPKGGLCFVKRMSANVWLVISQVLSATQFTRVKAWGDSITAGTGATSPELGYINRESEILGIPFVNYAVGNATAWDQALQVFTPANAIAVNEAAQLMIGTNDSRYGTADANNVDTFKRAHAALLAWLAIPAVYRIRGQDSRIAYTGTWTDSNAYAGGLTKASATAGDVASFSFTGTTVYICSSRTSLASNTAAATVRIDGNVVGTITAKGFTAATNLGATYGPALYRFGNLTNTAHTVTITTTTAAGSNPLFLDWVGFPSASSSRLVNNINLPPQVVAAVPSAGAWVTAYNTAIADNITTLVGDGLRINLTNVTPTFDASTDLTADGVHPNNAGHLKIATLAAESLLR